MRRQGVQGEERSLACQEVLVTSARLSPSVLHARLCPQTHACSRPLRARPRPPRSAGCPNVSRTRGDADPHAASVIHRQARHPKVPNDGRDPLRARLWPHDARPLLVRVSLLFSFSMMSLAGVLGVSFPGFTEAPVVLYCKRCLCWTELRVPPSSAPAPRPASPMLRR